MNLNRPRFSKFNADANCLGVLLKYSSRARPKILHFKKCQYCCPGILLRIQITSLLHEVSFTGSQVSDHLLTDSCPSQAAFSNQASSSVTKLSLLPQQFKCLCQFSVPQEIPPCLASLPSENSCSKLTEDLVSLKGFFSDFFSKLPFPDYCPYRPMRKNWQVIHYVSLHETFKNYLKIQSWFITIPVYGGFSLLQSLCQI